MKTDTGVAMVSLGDRRTEKCTMKPIEERPQRWVLLLDGSLCKWHDQKKSAHIQCWTPMTQSPLHHRLVLLWFHSATLCIPRNACILRRFLPNFACFELWAIRSPQIMTVVGNALCCHQKDGIVLIPLPSQCCFNPGTQRLLFYPC